MQLTNQDLGKIKKLARKWGKIITEEAFGPEGPLAWMFPSPRWKMSGSLQPKD